MKKYLIAALLLVCGVYLRAQEPVPADKAKAAAPAQKTTEQARPAKTAAVKTAASAAEKKAVKAAPAKAAAAKEADQDAEESVVMIDSKSDAEDNGSFNAGEDREDVAVPGGLPSSYGQCKGVMNEGGRTLLVFESPEDGAVSFVQVTVGKAGVSWKLVDRIARSAD